MQLPTMLEPLVAGYGRWLDRQERRIGDDASLAGFEPAATEAIVEGRNTLEALRLALDLLGTDPDARTAFAFANRAMWQQRVHSEAAKARRGDATLSPEDAVVAADITKNRSWRPFQLAFILLNIPSLTHPTHADRVGPGLADLLFFPTGGGKTEAYLGLTAFTLAIRRLQGVVAGRDGSDGVAVVMRYTLRLLTSQQFQRAAALLCACELIRREDPERWGAVPFRIGMWVGSSVTPNRTAAAAKALEDEHGLGGPSGGRHSSPVQLVSCPWCGSDIDPAVDARSDVDRWRTLVFCGDDLGRCEFTERGSPAEGLPVVTVDEEIYRLLPSLVISTADKWAMLPWKGELHLLFGSAQRKCTRHGYRSDDLDVVGDKKEADKHARTGVLPPAQTVAITPLRPPDLIIQDELHLISGPLGTLVGLVRDGHRQARKLGRGRRHGAAEARGIHRDDPPGGRPGLCGVLAQGADLSAARAGPRRLVLCSPAPDQRGRRPALRGDLRARPAAEVRRGARLLHRARCRPEDLRALRDRRRPVDDPRRLLQRAPRTRRHASPRRGRGGFTPASGRPPRPCQPQVPRGQGTDQPDRVDGHPGHPGPAVRLRTIPIARRARRGRSMSCSRRT